MKLVTTKLKSEFLSFQEELQAFIDSEKEIYTQSNCLIPRDDPAYVHSLLFPKIHHQQIKTKSEKSLEFLPLFKNKYLFTETKVLDPSSTIALDHLQIYPSPSSRQLQERFDRILKISMYHQKKIWRGNVGLPKFFQDLLKDYKKQLFLQSFFDLNDKNVEAENIIETAYSNYCWFIDGRNRPKGQRVQIRLKDIHQSKKEFQRKPLAEKSNQKPPPTAIPVAVDSLTQIPTSQLEGIISQDQDQDLGESNKITNAPDEGKYAGSLSILSNEDDFQDEALTNFSGVGTLNFLADSESSDLGINDNIHKKYNCLYVAMGEKFQSVLALARYGIYICINYCLNEEGNVVPVPASNKLDHSQWVLPLKKSSSKDNQQKSGLTLQRQNSIISVANYGEPLDQDTHKIINIPYQDLVEIHATRYLLKPNALHLLTASCKSYFLAVNVSLRKEVFTEILLAHSKFFNPKSTTSQIDLPLEPTFFAVLGGEPFLPQKSKKSSSSSSSQSSSERKFSVYRGLYLAQLAQTMWVEAEISNLEYLNLLNVLGGRTYNDISQYPVFPWTILQHEQTIDFRDPEIYRSLERPMGAITEERAEIARRRYNDLKEGFSGTPAHHFGSHYSSPGMIMYFLIRIFPFSQYAANLQGGHFDFPDRLFNKISYTLNLAMTIDYKEIVPEFFMLPEFLMNLNHFNLGVTQQKGAIDNIVMPKWALSDPRHYTNSMRRALESDHATRNINNWIDLIFGYKQRGKNAYEATNLFHVLTYEDTVDLKAVNIPLHAILTQISEFGVCPRRLFFEPHPLKKRLANANFALFESEDSFKSCLINHVHKLKEVVRKSGKIKRHPISEIKASKEPLFDLKVYGQGLRSYQKAKVNFNLEAGSESEKVSHYDIMYNTKGFLFRGANFKQIINWSNYHNVLLLFSSESVGDRVWAFSDPNFIDISCAHFNHDDSTLILGTKNGKLMIFHFEETVIKDELLSPKSSNEITKVKESSTGAQTSVASVETAGAAVENKNQQIYLHIKPESSIKGVEVKENLLKHKTLQIFKDKEYFTKEDFIDLDQDLKIKSASTFNLEPLNNYSKFQHSADSAIKLLKNTLLKTKKKTVSLKEKASILEAHEGSITAVALSNLWGVIITGDSKGTIRSWDLTNCKLIMMTYSYHFKDQDLLSKSQFKNAKQNIFLEDFKRAADREEISLINICQANGDFVILSKNYVSIYTINHVLISLLNTDQAGLPSFTSALLTKNCYSFEEDTLICGHKEGVISFWSLKKSPEMMDQNSFRASDSEYSNILKGVFSHRYDKSIYINKSVPLDTLVPTQKVVMSQAFKTIDKQSRVSSLNLSSDQTILYIGLDNGEIYYIR